MGAAEEIGVSELARLEQVEVQSGRRTILSLDRFSVQEGEIQVVLGPTGAGKSTLLRVLNLLQWPHRGRLFWRNQELHRPAPLRLRRQISMSFQEPLLFHGSVFANVAYGLHLRGVRGLALEKQVMQTLQRFGIAALAHQSAQKISGGEAQRTALARALVLGPELLLLDEPLASLDQNTKDCLASELRQILRLGRMTCVWVTHDQEEALAMADRIAVLEQGTLRQVGTPEEVFFAPQNAMVARFVRTENILPGTVEGNADGLASIRVQDALLEAITSFARGAQVLVCLRPEDVSLRRDGESGSESTRNRLRCTIRELRLQGATVRVRLDCGFPLLALITRRSAQEMALTVGETVLASFKATAIHCIPNDE